LTDLSVTQFQGVQKWISKTILIIYPPQIWTPSEYPDDLGASFISSSYVSEQAAAISKSLT
jgi:hypothetical protein